MLTHHSPEPEPPHSDVGSHGAIFAPITRRAARLIFATALALLGVWMARSFLVALGWAVIL